jgi:hypothetical protein
LGHPIITAADHTHLRLFVLGLKSRATFSNSYRKKGGYTMHNQYFFHLLVLANLPRLMGVNPGDSTVNTSEMRYLINKEQQKDWGREIKQQRLLAMAGLPEGLALKMYRQSVSWLGRQMVKWGAKLQNYGPTTQELLTQDVKNHHLKYS